MYQALSKEVLLHKPLKETDDEGRQLSTKAMLHTLAHTHTGMLTTVREREEECHGGEGKKMAGRGTTRAVYLEKVREMIRQL